MRLLPASAALLLGAAPLAAQTVAPGYEVGTWHGFREAAVTHTFDDNTANQLPVAVPLFDEFDLNATFFVVTNWGPDWAGFAAAAAEGHEVTSHTVTHPQLNTLPEAQQTTELAASRDVILANVPDAEALTLAYPFCNRGSDAVTSQYYIAARGCSGQIVPATPPDMLNISSIIVGTEGAVKTAADFNARAEAAAGTGGWAVFLIHGVDNDGGWSPVPSAEIRGHLEYLSENRDRFWVDTFGNVVRYIRERDAASVTEVSASDVEVVVEVTDPLDDAVYDVPITVRRALPEGWASAVVTQGGAAVPSEIVEVGGEAHVQFDVVPDGGPIVLARSGGTSTSENAEAGRTTFLVGSRPNPFQSTTSLLYEVGAAGQVTIEVYDVLGRKLETLVDRAHAPGRHAVGWDATGYEAGTYTYRLGAGDHVDAGHAVLTR